MTPTTEPCPVRAWLSRAENLRAVCAVARGYAGGGVQADDVASAAIERALAHAEKFVGGNVGAWVCTITRRLGLNAQRDAATRRRVCVYAGELGDGVDVDGSHEPSAAWDGEVLVDEVRAEARRMGVEREFTRYMDGETPSELGRELGASCSTITRRVARAARALSEPAPQAPQTPRPRPRGGA